MPLVAEVISLSMMGLGVVELIIILGLLFGAVYFATRRRRTVETHIDTIVGNADTRDSSNPYAPSNVATRVVRSRTGGPPSVLLVLFFIGLAFAIMLLVLGMSATVVTPTPVTIPLPPPAASPTAPPAAAPGPATPAETVDVTETPDPAK